MKLLRSCKLNILQWRINPKYAFVAMYMVLYMWYEVEGLWPQPGAGILSRAPLAVPAAALRPG